MKNSEFSDKTSVYEHLLLLLLCICYAASLYFLVLNHRTLLLLFFILHSALSIVFMLIVHDRMKRSVLSQSSNAAKELEEELFMITKYKEDISSLKKEREELILEKERLAAKQGDYEKQIVSLTDALEQEKQHQQSIRENASLSLLLPHNEQPLSFNILDTANEVIEEMLPFCRQAGVQLTLSSSADQLMMHADPDYIRILFCNIIDNSIKYMRRNGSLVITVSHIGDDLFIVLKDNGQGLPAEEIPYIFDLNYQGSNRISGNGLGLAQAKAIADYYGGTIYGKSDSGSGMGIYIQLPMQNH